MKERFGASVESGTVAKLRQLAGSERRIGEYLSAKVAELWANRDTPDRQQDVEQRLATAELQLADLQQTLRLMLSFMTVTRNEFGEVVILRDAGTVAASHSAPASDH